MLRVTATLLLLCLPLAGCNVFESFQNEGSSSDPDILLQDAKAALDRGEPEKARDYLRKAHENDPDHPGVRIELSAVELEIRGISVLLIRDLADFTRENSPTGSSASVVDGNARFADQVCNFSRAEEPSAEVFNYAELDAYLTLSSHDDALEVVIELLEGITVHDLSKHQRARLFMLDSTVRIARSIVRLQRVADEFDVTLYRLASGAIGACANLSDGLEAFEEIASCELLDDLKTALNGLKHREELISSGSNSALQEIIAALEEAISLLDEELDTDC